MMTGTSKPRGPGRPPLGVLEVDNDGRLIWTSVRPRRQVTLTREKLYELVWTITRPALTAKYILSPHWLSVVCAHMNIPTPGHSYWNLRKSKRKQTQSPLPERRGAPDTLVLRGSNSKPLVSLEDAAQENQADAPGRPARMLDQLEPDLESESEEIQNDEAVSARRGNRRGQRHWRSRTVPWRIRRDMMRARLGLADRARA